MNETLIKQPFVLREGQENAVKAMLDWVQAPHNSADDLYFTLTGSAGTGKTTVLDQFIKRCPLYIQRGLCVTAPTHKAKKVIAKATQLTAQTIQALLGLRPNTELDNFDHNKPQFDPLNEGKIGDYRVIIIDETSMINSDLFDLLLEESAKAKTKILFVGDALQLPPVNEISSRTLTEIDRKAELTEVIRQANTNPIAELLKALREDILLETDSFFDIINENPIVLTDKENIEGYACLNKTEFSKEMIKHFRDYRFIENKDFVKYTAWQNKTVKSGNEYIRRTINPSNEIIATNDLLMGYSSITEAATKISPGKIIIVNSEDYLVTAVTPQVDANMIKGYQVTLYRESVSEKDRVVHIFIIDHTDCETFLMYHNDLLRKAKTYGKGAWKSYYTFKNKYILLSELKEGDKILSKKDLDYGYGITVHKTQGSTYDNIFINLGDIQNVVGYAKEEGMKNAQRLMKQLIYVAISRAKNVAYILID